MTRATSALAKSLALLVFIVTAGCLDFKIFESTTIDPHPPAILDLQFGPSNIFTGEVIKGTFVYSDPGGDIETLNMRDLKGNGTIEPTPPPIIVRDEQTGEDVEEIPSVFFFPGQSGQIEWQMIFETNQPGTHTIKVWLEDSKGSRSEPIFFDVFVNF